MEASMRYAVEYELQSGTIGLMIFTAADEEAAQEYVRLLTTEYGHTHVSRPTPLPIDVTVADLYHLFPRKTDSLLKT
jgi:hypothetical protein